MSDQPRLDQLDPNMAVPSPEGDLLWYDLLHLGREGQGWSDLAHPYDRLPARAEGEVTEAVWTLSHHTAGLCARFVTDATTISARWAPRFESLAMDHMPASGVSGLDLYVRHEGELRWLGVGRGVQRPLAQSRLIADLPPGTREYTLYLPLYNGVDSVELGLPPEATLSRLPRREEPPLVFYGTSITHGGCASRPGMAYPALLGRWLELPTLNLGFSGSGRMEPAMAALLGELDPAAYVLDCLPNLSPEETQERVEPFLVQLRAARPATPILLVENLTYCYSYLQPATGENVARKNAHLRGVFARRAADDPHLHYREGAGLLGEDSEATVDGVHPTDLGFLRLAQGLLPALQHALGR